MRTASRRIVRFPFRRAIEFAVNRGSNEESSHSRPYISLPRTYPGSSKCIRAYEEIIDQPSHRTHHPVLRIVGSENLANNCSVGSHQLANRREDQRVSSYYMDNVG